MSGQGGRQLLLGVAALFLLLAAPMPARARGLPPDPAPVRQGQGIDVDIAGDVIIGRPVDITVRAANPAQDASQGSLTVSFTGGPSVEITGASTDGAKLYQPGEQMYNFGLGRAATIQNPAAELYVSSWPTGVRHELRLRVTASAPFSLLARASLRRANGTFLNLPANGTPDQQGAPTRQIQVTPKSAQPPTQPPPRPTVTSPPAPPTATAAPPPKPTVAPPAGGSTDTPSGQPQGATAPPPTPTAPPPPTAAPTPAPQPTAAVASSTSSGPSVPLLLAGLGVIAVGIAIGLLALMLVLRRRSAPAAPPWAGTYPGMPYGQPGPYGQPNATPYPGQPGATPYPGQPGPMPYPLGNQAGWPVPPTPAPGAGAPPAPWDRPATPAADPRQERPRSWPAGAAPPTRADQPPTEATPRPPADPSPWPPGNPGGGLQTPGPTGVEGLGGATPSNERYTDRSLVGRGGMGSVYKAYDSRLRRWVALKIMHADLGLRPGFVDRFIREAQMAAMLEHPNIVTVYDVEPLGDSIQMVMSWIEGEDLQRLLERQGALGPELVARLLDQMAAALDHAHQRERPILHRDIKPSNIMIGPHERVVLTDFGIARLIGDVSLTQTGQIVGTPAFMAPEVVQGAEADARADVYALAVVLYQMLTGRAPFRAETPLALLHAHVHTPPPAPRIFVPALPPAVDQVLLRALAKDPSERFQSAGALARAFRASIGRA
jgi:hypothetical protein